MLGLEAEMTSILDRTDLVDGENVTLYIQVLQRYNDLADRRVKKKPMRVAVVYRCRHRGERSENDEDQGQLFDGPSQN